MNASYREQLESFLSTFDEGNNQLPARQLEWAFERFRDWSVFGPAKQCFDWFYERRRATDMRVEVIALNDCEGWEVDPSTGNIASTTGEFFIVEGIRVRTGQRESRSGWDQPIITQIGFDGGIIGLLTQRWDGIPHYLVEAKSEPGNPDLVQLSPTLQATFSNLSQVHGGRQPHFSSLFTDPPSATVQVHVEHWMSEDGGRLRNKRNKGMIVESEPGHVTEIPDSFAWMSLFQIQMMVRSDSLGGPHIRSLLALM